MAEGIEEIIGTLTSALEDAESSLSNSVSDITEHIQAAENATGSDDAEVDEDSLETLVDSVTGDVDVSDIASTIADDVKSAVTEALDEALESAARSALEGLFGGEIGSSVRYRSDEVRVSSGGDDDEVGHALRRLHSRLESGQSEMEERLGLIREALDNLGGAAKGGTEEGDMIYLKYVDGEWTVCDPQVDHVMTPEQAAASIIERAEQGQSEDLFGWKKGYSVKVEGYGDAEYQISAETDDGDFIVVMEGVSHTIGKALLIRPSYLGAAGERVYVGQRVRVPVGSGATEEGVLYGKTVGTAHEIADVLLENGESYIGSGRNIDGTHCWTVAVDTISPVIR